jgi:hypothetical protein
MAEKRRDVGRKGGRKRFLALPVLGLREEKQPMRDTDNFSWIGK